MLYKKTIGVLRVWAPDLILNLDNSKFTFDALYPINDSITAYNKMFVNKVYKHMLSGHNCRVPEVRL